MALLVYIMAFVCYAPGLGLTRVDLRWPVVYIRLQRWAHIRTGIGQDQDWSQFWPDRTGSDCNFFENWRIKTVSDRQNFSCICVIILNISTILVVIQFYRLAKWKCILPWMAKALLRQFCNSNCTHLCEHITLSSSSNVNIQ